MMEPPDQRWIEILDTRGLAVVLTLVFVFVFIPVASWYAVRGCKALAKWLAAKAERIIEGHLSFLDQTSSTLQKGAETQEQIQKLVADSGIVDKNWHEEKMQRLGDIQKQGDKLLTVTDRVLAVTQHVKEGVDDLHKKLDRAICDELDGPEAKRNANDDGRAS